MKRIEITQHATICKRGKIIELKINGCRMAWYSITTRKMLGATIYFDQLRLAVDKLFVIPGAI